MATRASLAPSLSDYSQDVALWANEQIALLRARRFADLDIEHIIEEIEAVGISARLAISSQIARIIEHFLKLEFSPARDPRRGWMESVPNARSEIDRVFDAAPSLRRAASEMAQHEHKRMPKLVAMQLLNRGEIDRDGEAAILARRYTADEILGDWLPADPA